MVSLIEKQKKKGGKKRQPFEMDVLSKWEEEGWEKFSSFKEPSPQILEMELYGKDLLLR